MKISPTSLCERGVGGIPLIVVIDFNEPPRRKQRGILMEQKHSFLRRKRRGIIPYEIKVSIMCMTEIKNAH